MCIGDSITQGGGVKDEYTYRLPLYSLLRKSGITVDYIGARTTGLRPDFVWPSGFDTDHESQYGATTEYIDEMIKKDLTVITSVPDIALIDVGSNDEGKKPDRYVIPFLVDIIMKLRSINPSVKILVAQIPGIRTNLKLHLDVFLMSKRYSSPSSPIITVPLYWGWNKERFTFDGSHPNPAGQDYIAQKFYKKILHIIQFH